MNDSTKNTLYIKNMVCPRCIKVVREELEKLGAHIKYITLGEVVTEEKVDDFPLDKIAKVLEENGFELIEDESKRLIEQIKKEVISVIYEYEYEDLEKLNWREHLSEKIQKDYHYLSNLFSKTESITIEHYIILQKIERAKELLKYGELTLSEIAFKLGYSSVQHLSRQFKEVTGFTASEFKNNVDNLKKPIDGVG